VVDRINRMNGSETLHYYQLATEVVAFNDCKRTEQ